jgi:N-acetylneuraminic acid mutarotase
MNIARAFHSTVALNNKLYAIGGRENPNEIDSKIKDSLAVYTIEEYDIAKDKWRIKTVMPDKHFIIGAVALNNKIYMLADTASNFKLSSAAIFEEYDPTKNTFRRLESLSPSRYDAAMVVSDNKIYVIGGWIYHAVSNVDVYDPVTDKWEQENALPYPVQNLQAVSIHCNIFISGGIFYSEDGNEKKKNILEYSNCEKF